MAVLYEEFVFDWLVSHYYQWRQIA
ncbi:uncharacterized protein METZ01_LOCUS228678 [marine metagenome]|uniref:Uncharacterized protein n=1 Tax=marine metagenome TaxID=408172 RepID=A0A382GLZ3_9ZZZZ